MAELSGEQEAAMSVVLQGKNVFITGAAGTGKSHLMHSIIGELENRKLKHYVTSSTGASAINIEGTTIHSFAGIGLGDEPIEELLKRVRMSKAVLRWKIAKVLIMDEISMVDSDLFTKLDLIGRDLRVDSQDLPFGGIQIVVVGDFYQLPPVSGNYAFESLSWKTSIPRAIVLKEIHRQTESALIEGLNEMRGGRVSPEFITLLTKDKEAFYKKGGGVLPSRLLSRNKDVDDTNRRELSLLKEEKVTFKSVDHLSEKFLKDAFAIGEEITLAVGAQVMMLRNTDTYVNGTRGVVIKISKKDEYVEVKGIDGTIHTVTQKIFEARRDGKVVGTRRNLPLKLAWAISIHKAQGSSIDYLDVNLEGVFSPAQSYVAISRATNLDGLRVTGLSPTVVYCDMKVVAFYQALEKEEEERKRKEEETQK